MKFDFLVVGAGLFGAVVAHEASTKGLRVLVVEKQNFVGGNCYTESIDGINVHNFGAHIFRTDDTDIWNYMRQFCEFNNFVNSPIASFHGELYNLPFNMNTFNKLWGVVTPQQARKKIASQCIKCDNPSNLEEHILGLVGTDIYEILVKGYTEKQWGKPCNELPPSIMRRIPLRFTYDNNYFNARYQGIPIGGYTAIFEKMLDGVELRLGCDFLKYREELEALADRIIYTGPIDEYFNYCFGPLEYRSLYFEHEILDTDNYQGVAVMNYTDAETPYTRTIEHKHFEFGTQPHTVISYEYPATWVIGEQAYYPMEDASNASRYAQYKALADRDEIIFGGRLGEYKYYDMQDTIKSALSLIRKVL